MIEKMICLGGHSVRVLGASDSAEAMLDFMFDDIPEQATENVEASFTLIPNNGGWAVRKNDEQIYSNSDLTDAANYLMGEVVFHLIENNKSFMAIHAALLSNANGGILLPGESGNGKSSLSMWMTLNGYHYHTDELVLIEPDSLKTRVFTRPFNIKSHGLEAIKSLINLEELNPSAKCGNFITMIPHRALNSDFISHSPNISRIVFPKFDQTGENRFEPMSRAGAGIELMKTHVIARNLPGHGFDQLLYVVKSVPAFRLNYNHFDALPKLLSSL